MRLAHRLLLQSLVVVAVMVISVVVIIDQQLHSSITEQTIHDLVDAHLVTPSPLCRQKACGTS